MVETDAEGDEAPVTITVECIREPVTDDLSPEPWCQLGEREFNLARRYGFADDAVDVKATVISGKLEPAQLPTPAFFRRTLDMPEGFSHQIVYYKKPDGELHCIVHQVRPTGGDFWSIESHLEGFVVFTAETDIEVSEAEFRATEDAARAAMSHGWKLTAR